MDIPINSTTTTGYPAILPNPADLSSNTKFNDNKDKVKSAEVTKLSLKLNEFVGTPDASSADVDFEATYVFDPSYGDATVYSLGTIQGKTPADFMTTAVDLNVSNAQLNTALNLIKDRPKFTVFLKGIKRSGGIGTVSKITGTISVTFKLKTEVL
jgi:hypothetical protein